MTKKRRRVCVITYTPHARLSIRPSIPNGLATLKQIGTKKNKIDVNIPMGNFHFNRSALGRHIYLALLLVDRFQNCFTYKALLSKRSVRVLLVHM